MDRINAKFEALGITGWAKWTIIGTFCVLSTMETIFYTQVAWRWWKGTKDSKETPEH